MATKVINIQDAAYTLTYTMTSSGAIPSALTKNSDGTDWLNRLKVHDDFLAEILDIEQDARNPHVGPSGTGEKRTGS